MPSSVLSSTTPDSRAQFFHPVKGQFDFIISFQRKRFHGIYLFLQIVERSISQLASVINGFSRKFLIGRVRAWHFGVSESQIRWIIRILFFNRGFLRISGIGKYLPMVVYLHACQNRGFSRMTQISRISDFCISEAIARNDRVFFFSIFDVYLLRYASCNRYS